MSFLAQQPIICVNGYHHTAINKSNANNHNISTTFISLKLLGQTCIDEAKGIIVPKELIGGTHHVEQLPSYIITIVSTNFHV